MPPVAQGAIWNPLNRLNLPLLNHNWSCSLYVPPEATLRLLKETTPLIELWHICSELLSCLTICSSYFLVPLLNPPGSVNKVHQGHMRLPHQVVMDVRR